MENRLKPVNEVDLEIPTAPPRTGDERSRARPRAGACVGGSADAVDPMPEAGLTPDELEARERAAADILAAHDFPHDHDADTEVVWAWTGAALIWSARPRPDAAVVAPAEPAGARPTAWNRFRRDSRVSAPLAGMVALRLGRTHLPVPTGSDPRVPRRRRNPSLGGRDRPRGPPRPPPLLGIPPRRLDGGDERRRGVEAPCPARGARAAHRRSIAGSYAPSPGAGERRTASASAQGGQTPSAHPRSDGRRHPCLGERVARRPRDWIAAIDAKSGVAALG